MTTDAPGPFDVVRVIVSSHGAGRMLRQGLAAAGPVGISAGIEFLTPDAWVIALGREHGLTEELAAWRSRRLEFTVWEQLQVLADEGEFSTLAAHLASPSPGRAQATARRLARLARHYLAQAPDLLQSWLDGSDEGTDGEPLPEHLAWQPELFRRVGEALGVDPAETYRELAQAMVEAEDHPRTAVFAVPELTRPELGLVAALAQAAPVPVWHVPAAQLPDWPAALAEVTESLDDGPSEAPEVSLHGSHGATRQAQVLRDELCRLFEADPALEPRDVAIVTPELELWWPVLQSVFAPLPDATAHPGRQLRLQAGGVVAPPNLVLETLAGILALGDGRATAAQVIELLTSRTIAHRWRLADRAKLTELVSAAEVRWGLDARHRSSHGLAEVTQNTWTRGLDRLLAGLALPLGEVVLPVTGVEGVATSDLELIGTLCEVLSRIRRFIAGSEIPASPAGWVQRSRDLLEDLVGLGWDDEWMLAAALAALTELGTDLRSSDPSLTRAQFARLVDDLARELPVRPAVGNGSMQVMAAGDLMHVGFRVVCLVGVTDASPAPLPDVVPLGDVPDERRLRLARLLAHARAAERVVIVQQDRSEVTNLPVATPTAITWLLRELGDPANAESHPLAAHSPANFQGHVSFDRGGAAAARALLGRRGTGDSPATLRRRAALALPAPEGPATLKPADLVAFLRDPLKVFLRSAAGVRLFEPPATSDEIPLLVGGLSAWGIRDRLLGAARTGTAVADAERAEFQRETLPPGQIGRAALALDVEVIGDLWGRARDDWQGDVVDHRVELTVGELVVRGTVRTRGGKVVTLTGSDGPRTLIEAWVNLLLLAASGIEAGAAVHRIRRHFSKRLAESVSLTQPDRQAAGQHLAHLATATRLAHGRLIPLPLNPAMAWLEQRREGTTSPRLWQLPTTSWDSPWQWRDRHWELFYDGAPSELFDDPPTPLDPQTLQGSGFEAWTLALLAPLVEASRG